MPKLLPNLSTAAAPQRPEVPPLTWPDKILISFAILFGAGVGALGLATSFGALSRAAQAWGFGYPWMLPAGVDLAVPAFSAAYLVLIRLNMPLAWVRFVPWALTAVTCWLNVEAGDSLSSKLAHGTMPMLWVGFAEIVAHVYKSWIGAATGRRMESIRFLRWFLAPVSTFIIWRRMTLWEITSYAVALERERDRQLVRAELREKYGRGWRRKTPARERVLLKMGGLIAVIDEPHAPSAEVPAQLPAPAVEQLVAETDRLADPAAIPAVLPAPRAQVTASIVPAQFQPGQAIDVPAPDVAEPATPPPAATSDETPVAVMSEEELYAVVCAAIEAGEVDRFTKQNGDLTGSNMGRALGQTAGNGRKVRHRLLKRYAAATGKELGDEFTVEDLMTAANS
ncbi:DUF2637 domain-containing protein [Streptomyces sp. NPDC048258]|uniref:DUF2637 domain-containing protein n=1 Tax=Streptomyces sp. NPDC048258 TaxID=3365527 RepID=UPI003713B309